jgi:DNA-directed RNA polymerase subunit RPC12/RpoP
MGGYNCAICSEKIEEEFGKLKGTIVKVNDENKKTQFIYVCPDCMKKDGWVEKAKIKGA